MMIHAPFLISVILCILLPQDDAFVRAVNLAKPYNITVVAVNTPELWATQALVIENQLLINVQRFRWAVVNQAHARSLNWSSTDCPDHIIIHEISHFLLYRKIGRDAYDRLNRPVALGYDHVSTIIGNYAATCEGEFTAEVFTGLQTGIIYPDDIMKHYLELWNGH